MLSLPRGDVGVPSCDVGKLVSVGRLDSLKDGNVGLRRGVAVSRGVRACVSVERKEQDDMWCSLLLSFPCLLSFLLSGISSPLPQCKLSLTPVVR